MFTYNPDISAYDNLNALITFIIILDTKKQVFSQKRLQELGILDSVEKIIDTTGNLKNSLYDQIHQPQISRDNLLKIVGEMGVALRQQRIDFLKTEEENYKFLMLRSTDTQQQNEETKSKYCIITNLYKIDKPTLKSRNGIRTFLYKESLPQQADWIVTALKEISGQNSDKPLSVHIEKDLCLLIFYDNFIEKYQKISKYVNEEMLGPSFVENINAMVEKCKTYRKNKNPSCQDSLNHFIEIQNFFNDNETALNNYVAHRTNLLQNQKKVNNKGKLEKKQKQTKVIEKEKKEIEHRISSNFGNSKKIGTVSNHPSIFIKNAIGARSTAFNSSPTPRSKKTQSFPKEPGIELSNFNASSAQNTFGNIEKRKGNNEFSSSLYSNLPDKKIKNDLPQIQMLSADDIRNINELKHIIKILIDKKQCFLNEQIVEDSGIQKYLEKIDASNPYKSRIQELIDKRDTVGEIRADQLLSILNKFLNELNPENIFEEGTEEKEEGSWKNKFGNKEEEEEEEHSSNFGRIDQSTTKPSKNFWLSLASNNPSIPVIQAKLAIPNGCTGEEVQKIILNYIQNKLAIYTSKGYLSSILENIKKDVVLSPNATLTSEELKTLFNFPNGTVKKQFINQLFSLLAITDNLKVKVTSFATKNQKRLQKELSVDIKMLINSLHGNEIEYLIRLHQLKSILSALIIYPSIDSIADINIVGYKIPDSRYADRTYYAVNNENYYLQFDEFGFSPNSKLTILTAKEWEEKKKIHNYLTIPDDTHKLELQAKCQFLFSKSPLLPSQLDRIIKGLTAILKKYPEKKIDDNIEDHLHLSIFYGNFINKYSEIRNYVFYKMGKAYLAFAEKIGTLVTICTNYHHNGSLLCQDYLVNLNVIKRFYEDNKNDLEAYSVHKNLWLERQKRKEEEGTITVLTEETIQAFTKYYQQGKAIVSSPASSSSSTTSTNNMPEKQDIN